MNRLRLFLFFYAMACVVGVLHGESLFGKQLQGEQNAEYASDILCGPRCVQFVLSHFGIKSDLIDLTREIQWPELESGASLKAVSEALESRGLHTCAVHIDPHHVVDWQFPVISHSNSRDSKIGHFHLWLPESTEDQIVIWDGPAGQILMSQQEWARRRSGAILLVSPDLITEPARAIKEFARFQLYAGILLVLGGVVALFKVFARTRSSIK